MQHHRNIVSDRDLLCTFYRKIDSHYTDALRPPPQTTSIFVLTSVRQEGEAIVSIWQERLRIYVTLQTVQRGSFSMGTVWTSIDPRAIYSPMVAEAMTLTTTYP